MERSKIKVGIISDDLGREAMGTALVGRRLIEHLTARYGGEVEVTVVHKEGKYAPEIFSNVREVTVPTVALPKWRGFVSYLVFFLTTKERFDVIHLLRPSIHPFLWILKVRGAAKRIVVTFHGAPDDANVPIFETAATKFNRWFIAAIGRFFIDVAIADARGAEGQVIRYYRLPARKVRSIYLGVDTGFTPLAPGKKRAAEKLVGERYGIAEPYILTVARMDPHKNLDRLLEAFFMLKRERSIPHALVIVGRTHEPLYSRKILSLIESSHYRASVHVVPFVAAEDFRDVYALADCFAFVSLSEGFGLPLVEAMASGVPTVTSDASVLPEIASGASMLVNPRKPEDIARGLREVLEKASLKAELRKRGVARAISFSWGAMAERNIALYREVLAR